MKNKPYQITTHAHDRANQRLSMNLIEEDAVKITNAYETGEHYGCIPSQTKPGSYIMLLDVRGRLGAWCIHPQHRRILSVLPILFDRFQALQGMRLGGNLPEYDQYDEEETENEVDSRVYLR